MEHVDSTLDAYTIQESSFEYADNAANYSEAEKLAVRRSAFDRGLDEDQVRRVFGIELRDVRLASVSKDAS